MNEYILILLRAFCIFIVLMIIIRLLGKREVGELSVFDLAIILIISDIGAMGIDSQAKTNQRKMVGSPQCINSSKSLQVKK